MKTIKIELTEHLEAGAEHKHCVYVCVPFAAHRSQLELSVTYEIVFNFISIQHTTFFLFIISYQTTAGFQATVTKHVALPVHEPLLSNVYYLHQDLSPITSQPLPLDTPLLLRVVVKANTRHAVRIDGVSLLMNELAGVLLDGVE